MAGIDQDMRRTGGDVDGVAGLDGKAFLPQPHQAAARRDVVKLFSDLMAMQLRALAGRERGLGQALRPIAMLRRMHQLADFGAVLGDVGQDVGVAGVGHALAGGGILASSLSSWLPKAWRSAWLKAAGPPVSMPALRSSSMKLRMVRRSRIVAGV